MSMSHQTAPTRMRVVASGTVAIQSTLEENLAIISELGFRELDLLLVTGWAHLGLDELADQYAAVCQRVDKLLNQYNLSIAAVNAKYSVRLEDESGTQIRQRELDAMLHFMQDFGVRRVSIQPTLTHDVAYLDRTWDASIREAARQQEYAMKQSLLMSMEPHVMSSVCTNAALQRVLAIYPDFRWTCDPSHLLHSGEPMDSLGYLAQNTAVAHLRDARKDHLFVPFGEGNLDVPFMIRSLHDAGYDGPIVLEYLSDKPDSGIYADLANFAHHVETCIAELYGKMS